jgi:hypothetical protein
MAARDGATTRFQEARSRALALLRGLGAGDRATLIAAGPTARVVAEGGASELAVLTATLDGLRPGGDGADLSGALTLAVARRDPQHEYRIVAISDGSSSSPLPPQAAESGEGAAPIDWQLVGGDQPNRAIVSFAARPWGDKLQVYARAANYAAAPFGGTLRLYGDERLLDTRAVNIAADGETELTWTLPAGNAVLRAALDGQDALPEDDQGFLAVAPPRPISVLLVSTKPEPLRRALAAAGAQISVAEPARYADALAAGRTSDITVFDGFLPPAWPAGAVLAINPPPGSALIEVGKSSGRAPEGALKQSGATLEGLSFGGVNFGAVQAITPAAWATTMLAIGDRPLILRGRAGANEIAVWAFDLASGNLPTRLAFPLLVARTMRDLAPSPLPSAIQAGAPLTLRPDPRAAALQLIAPDGGRSTLPSAQTLVIDSLTQPGFYRVEAQGSPPAAGGQIGVNAGSAVESDLRQRLPLAPEAAGDAQAAQTPQFAAPQVEANQPQGQARDLWPWLALGALALLMLEWGYVHR